MFSLFGIFASLTAKKDYIFLYGIMCLLFALVGYMDILGYENLYSSMDSQGTPAACKAYYGIALDDTPSICYGWISFLRVVVFTLIYMQPIQAFVAYYIYKEEKGLQPALGSSGSTPDYGSIEK